MHLLFYVVPFTYFHRSRLKTLKDWIFHGWSEWLVAFLILWVDSGYIFEALEQFAWGYLAFISIYEVGYIINDFIVTRREAKPRKRFGRDVSNSTIWIWVLVRLIIFTSFSFYMGSSAIWFVFYTGLILVFTLHNCIESGAVKIFTFLQLAIFRFWAPIIFFIDQNLVLQLFPIVLIYYVFNRSLTYMESKDILFLQERTNPVYRVQSAILILIFVSFWAVFTQSWMVIFLALYFCLFWVIIFLVSFRKQVRVP